MSFAFSKNVDEYNERSQYVLIVHRSTGAETERYDRLDDFRQRLLTLEKTLADEHWQRAAAPVLDPEGWPTRRPT